MLQAERQRVILQKVRSAWMLEEIGKDRPNKWQVIDWEWYTPGEIVYYIPHSALSIDDGDQTYYAVPKDQIVAKLLPDPTNAWTQRAED